MKSLKGHEYKFKLLYTVYYEDVFTIIIYIQIVIYKYISRQDYGLHFNMKKGKQYTKYLLKTEFMKLFRNKGNVKIILTHTASYSKLPRNLRQQRDKEAPLV